MTHSPVRMMFWAVCDTASKPNIARQPSQNTDEIGARLQDPSEFRVLLRITGVPRYRIAGSMSYGWVSWVVQFQLCLSVAALAAVACPWATARSVIMKFIGLTRLLLS
jgi:hypothetical protein